MYDSAAIAALIQQRRTAMTVDPQPELYQQPFIVNDRQTFTSEEVVAMFRKA